MENKGKRSLHSSGLPDIIGKYCDDNTATIKEYLRSIPYFGLLPESDLQKIAQLTRVRNYARGEYLAHQGTTRLKHVYLIRSGGISLIKEESEGPLRTGYIFSEEVFGGISLLMNEGISLRTVLVEEDTEACLIPSQVFLDVCHRHKDLVHAFVHCFGNNTVDLDLDMIISSGLVKFYLSTTPPFTALPESAISKAEKVLSLVCYPKGSRLFVSDQERVDYLYLLHKGTAVPYTRDTCSPLTVKALGEGDVYGGGSLLLQNGQSEHILEMVEDTFFYLLPGKVFLSLCLCYPEFKKFFTGEHRMSPCGRLA